uniref:CDP-archaeol synthase n=1 Tax=Thermofilum pendens TaxID=2269 RepID=A0A7C4B962_THEPE
MLVRVVEALIWILPAYVANAAPVVVTNFLKKRSRLHPLDFGRIFLDGRRVFGDNKTIEGFAGGFLAGVMAAFILTQLSLHSLLSGTVLSLGALLGDLAGAFAKRRMGIKPGDPVPLLDQLDFLVGAFAAYFIVFRELDPFVAGILVLLTPPIHLATNALAYIAGLKQHPW